MDLYRKVLYLLNRDTHKYANRYNRYWGIVKIIYDEQIIKEYEQKKSDCKYYIGAYVFNDNNTCMNTNIQAFCFDFQKVDSI